MSTFKAVYATQQDGKTHVSLEQLDRASLPAGDVFRARLILALADGLSYRDIERQYGASAPTVSLSPWTLG